MTLAPQPSPVGFIGLGVMGLPMARNLAQGGFPVVAFNRTAERINGLMPLAVAADSPAAVAEQVDILMMMVTDGDAVESILFGPSGAAHALRPGSIVIDSSSISPMTTRDHAARLARIGVTLLDAPVSGGQKGAIDGTLSFMVGGDQAAFARCRPILETMGSRITLIGETGAGQVAKACNQVIVAVSLLGIGEALLLAARSGVDPARVREAMLGGAAGGPILEGQGRRMLEHDFEPGFRTALHHKDMGIARELASTVGSPAQAMSIAADLFESLLASGLGDADHSAIITVLENLRAQPLAGSSLVESSAAGAHR